MHSAPPFLSLITVTRDAGATLPSTIRSVAAQKGLPAGCMEHLIVDGASTDATLEIARAYRDSAGGTDPGEAPLRVRVWSEPDHGLYHAMNRGMAMAEGDYLWFLNSGDEIAGPDVVAGLLDRVERHRKGDQAARPPDILYGETLIIDPFGEVVAPRRLKAPRHLGWWDFRRGMLVSHQSFLVRRELSPPYDLRYHFSADFDWAIRCMKRAERHWGGRQGILDTRMVLSRYLEHGLTTANRAPSLIERYRIMTHYYGKIPILLMHAVFAARFLLAKLFRRSVA